MTFDGLEAAADRKNQFKYTTYVLLSERVWDICQYILMYITRHLQESTPTSLTNPHDDRIHEYGAGVSQR